MTPAGSIVPVYPTLSFSSFAAKGSAKWRQSYPFSSANGAWAFSGRVALHLGLPVLDLPAHSTILVPNYFQGAEIDTLLANGFKLRFYRVDEDFTVDLTDAATRIDKSVSAFYIIHYFGFPQPLDTIKTFCQDHGLKMIEDCAVSLFSRSGPDWLGAVGDLALYSVYKTVPLPHGGFLVTKERKAEDTLRTAPQMSTFVQTKDLLHQHMRTSGWMRLESAILKTAGAAKRVLGWNREDTIGSGITHWDPRLLEYSASSWVVRLMRLVDPDFVITRRRENYAHLLSRLRDHVPTPPPFDELPDGVCPLFFPAMVEDKTDFQSRMAALGVGTINLWFDPHPACPPELAEQAASWRNHLIELPIHQGLSTRDVDRVADAVLAVLASP